MKIIAIDPGYDRCGVALMQKAQGSKEEIVYSQCIQTSSKEVYEKRLFEVGDQIHKLLDEHEPDFFVIEGLFFSKNTKTAMKVSETRGALLYLAQLHNTPIFEYTPNQIKVAVAGHGNASKKDVHLMTSRLVTLEQRSYKDDEIDAIAVGLTFFASYHPQIHHS